jgi:hypothetical protein
MGQLVKIYLKCYSETKRGVLMSMATGSRYGSMTPSLNRGKSKGGLTPFSMQQFTPEQMDLFGGMFGYLQPGGFLDKLIKGDEGLFQELEAPALKQFAGVQGNMASRFSGMGSGARNSSGFQNTMNQASSDFAQELQSQRLGLRNQALRDLMGMGNSLLQQRPYDQFVSEKKPSFLKQMLLGLAGPAAQGALQGYMGRSSGQSGGGFGQQDINSAMFSLFPYIV